jgi:sugar phosphate isomerase/epimerase
MSYSFNLALCNEVYQGWSFAAMCQSMSRFGYGGIEVAPFTLAVDPAAIPPAQRREYREIMRSEGLEYVGLHWLMASPAGLHVTTPDAALRRRSWDHVRALIDLGGDLAGDRPDAGVMVFGSPKQRCRTGGLSREEATRHYLEGLASVAPHAAARRVTILVEALPSDQCDVVLSLDEAAAIVREINHPAIRTMFDTHNAVEEAEPHAALVDRHFELIRHIHVNEMDGRHPGAGGYDFLPLLDLLARRNYAGWVSAEVFRFEPGAETIARETIGFLRRQIGRLGL